MCIASNSKPNMGVIQLPQFSLHGSSWALGIPESCDPGKSSRSVLHRVIDTIEVMVSRWPQSEDTIRIICAGTPDTSKRSPLHSIAMQEASQRGCQINIYLACTGVDTALSPLTS